MLAELVDHVIGIDPDRDWITAAVLDAKTTGVIATAIAGADDLPLAVARAVWWHAAAGLRAGLDRAGRATATDLLAALPQVLGDLRRGPREDDPAVSVAWPAGSARVPSSAGRGSGASGNGLAGVRCAATWGALPWEEWARPEVAR